MSLDPASKEKEIRLLHLDHVQKDVLQDVVYAFINGHPIDIRSIVASFRNYFVFLIKHSISENSEIFNSEGVLNSAYDIKLSKFIEAINLVAKIRINYHKIFSAHSVVSAIYKIYKSSGENIEHYIHEAIYVFQYEAYRMLDSNDDSVKDYAKDLEHFYLKSLSKVNPYMAKKLFVEHVVDVIRSSNEDSTIKDTMDVITKCTEYLGKPPPSYSEVEELVYRYSGDDRADQGALHATKVEVFKILEG
ncbi:MAG: hypothetical protein RLZZ59_889 [Pseudomonadota bacterium]|jgi:hypothetical protein